MLNTRGVHGWLSRNVFIPWVILGPWTSGRRQYRAALVEASIGVQTWQHSNPESRRYWVLNELRAIVRWAGTRVPYYRELFHRIGFDPRTDFSFSDYRRLPALDRDTVQSRAGDLIADGFSLNSLIANATGGSTGVPVHFWQDERSRAWREAISRWAFGHTGFRPGDRIGLVWGSNVDPNIGETLRAQLIDFLAHQQRNDCYRLSNEILDQIDVRLSQYQPDFLRCYTSASTLLARRLLARQKQPTYPKRGIITGGEKLDTTQRAIIEDVFKVPTYETYGSRDCGFIAVQLSSTEQRLYVAGANVVVEPFDEPDQHSGNEIAVTLLHNQAMPFLRYRIGDRARFPSDALDNPAEVLDEVTGRTLDHVCLPDGRLIHSIEFPQLFKDFDVLEYRVIQETSGDVQVQLVRGPTLTADQLARLERILADNLRGVSVALSLLPALERTAAGKLRPVISRYQPSSSFAEAP